MITSLGVDAFLSQCDHFFLVFVPLWGYVITYVGVGNFFCICDLGTFLGPCDHFSSFRYLFEPM